MSRTGWCLGLVVAIASVGAVGRAQAPPDQLPPGLLDKPAGGIHVGPADDTFTPDMPLPVRYDAGRFFVEPMTTNSGKMSFLTSTGDNNFIYSDAAGNLGVPILLDVADASIFLPELKPGHRIPLSRGSGGVMRVQAKRLRRAYLDDECSGILGHEWFAKRVWTLDYPAKTLRLRADSYTPPAAPKHRIPLRFRIGPRRQRMNNLPRISIKVAGESLDMLLQTGATVVLSYATAKAIGDVRPVTRAASFVTRTRLEAWQKRHGWRVIDKAERGGTGRMIEVPKVSIAGYDVGPVWFVAKPDRLYKTQLSRKLGAVIEGAVGGNLLRSFRITLDYPGAQATFETP